MFGDEEIAHHEPSAHHSSCSEESVTQGIARGILSVLESGALFSSSSRSSDVRGYNNRSTGRVLF